MSDREPVNHVDLVCVYCGVVADTQDHLVPRHLLERAEDLEIDLSRICRMRTWVLPACHECNSIIGARLYATLAERRAAAHTGIRRKYASYLRIPDWSEDELAVMGPMAKREIVAGLAVRDWVRKRLHWKGAKVVEDIGAAYGLSLDLARKRRAV